MKFIKKLINLFALGSSILCSASDNYDAYAYKIINDFSKENKQKLGWDLQASGGKWTTDVRTIDVCYYCYQELDYDQARRLYVDGINRLLKRMNADLTIRPYLRDFPSTWRNAELRLAFVQKGSRDDVRNGKVAMIQVVDGMLCYWVYNEARKDTVVTFEEPYEEAVKIVCKQNLEKAKP